MRAAGFVLVGGRSSRMGRDKALLPWRGGVLAGELAATVAAALGNVALIGSPERYSQLGFDCIADLRPGLGPLAGIEAALASGRGELNLILACDTPGIEAEELCALVEHARHACAGCVVTIDETGRTHPLYAVYRSCCLPVLRKALDERRLKLMDLLDELHAVSFHIGRKLENFNTPEDWLRAQTCPPTNIPIT
ncbi:MAG: molybdenum cofactor guanylyltransferase [Acidobacteriaceae bacterium]|nr:molybdenum cofactor guanylyltransferase [Acidobacteriaceae bacterium]